VQLQNDVIKSILFVRNQRSKPQEEI